MSKELREKRIVLYPAYFDKRLSRRLGRKVSLELSVPSPRLEEIVRAAEELGLEPIVEEDKLYPRTWFLSRGRVIVLKKTSKTKLLKMISEKIITYRKKK